MAGPDERRRRAWRFRLNDTSTLEVSTPPRATEKQVRRRGRWSLTVGALIAALMLSAVAGAAVWTDQQDYAPGSVVTISGDNSDGAGYLPGETVVVDVSGPNVWTASCTAIAEDTGAWSCQITLDSDPEVAVGDYSYTATGQDSGVSQSGTFTDAVTAAPVTLQNSACTTNQATFTLGDTVCARTTVTTAGGGNNDFRIQWLNPSSVVVETETFSSVSNGSSHTDTFTPTATGTWTVRSLSGTSGSNVLDSQQFTVAGSSDTTAPSISYSQTPDGDNGWFKTAPATVTVTATDTQSNISSIDCTLDDGAVVLQNTSGIGTSMTASGDIVTSNEGDHAVSCTATDSSGNTTSPAATASLKLDTVAPSITIITPANGASYVLNQVVIADYNCSDGTSGVFSCVGDVADGAAIDTSAVGSFDFTVDAEDYAGNTSTTTHGYTVKYAICLLYDPLKAHKAGSTVPVRFYLCDVNGVNVSGPGITVQATSLKKVDNNASGVLEDSGYANSPDNNFRYDPDLDSGNGGYIFNLSTKYPSPALGQKNALSTGTWRLYFAVDGVGGYSVTFDVK